jgi:hypothetical protein
MKFPQDPDSYGRDELSLKRLINAFKEIDDSDLASSLLETEPEKGHFTQAQFHSSNK